MISKNSTKIMKLTLLMLVVLDLIGTMKVTTADTDCNRYILKRIVQLCRHLHTQRQRRDVYYSPQGESFRNKVHEEFDNILDFSIPFTLNDSVTNERVDELYGQATDRWVRKTEWCPEEAIKKLESITQSCCTSDKSDCQETLLYEIC